MTNPHFIKLLTILEEREWDYYIERGLFYIMLGNQEYEFLKLINIKQLNYLTSLKTGENEGLQPLHIN